MSKLSTRKQKAVERLAKLADKMLIGSMAEKYRTCGNPTCRCHTTGPKHGPYLDVNYKDEHGRTAGYYVPMALHTTVRKGLAAWRQFQQTAKVVAEINKEMVLAQKASKTHSRKRK